MFPQVEAKIELADPWVIIADGLSIIRPNALRSDAGGGPVFGMKMVQESKTGGQKFTTYANTARFASFPSGLLLIPQLTPPLSPFPHRFPTGTPTARSA